MSDLAALVSRLEAVTQKLESLSSKDSKILDSDEAAAYVSSYGDFIGSYIDPFIEATDKVDCKHVKDAASLVRKIAEEQKAFLKIASKHGEPSQHVLAQLLKPMSQLMTEVGAIKDKNFKDKVYSSYTGAINEAIAAFGWVTINPAPGPYVKECGNGALFYTNRILKASGDKEWVNSLTRIFPALHDYVKTYHTTGTSWNKSAPIATVNASANPSPPPPPPPPVKPSLHASSVATTSGPDVSALLSDLNKGSAITTGLKKVTDDMKTHKNPQLRMQTAVPYKKPVPKTVSKPKADGPVRIPKLELVGKKWIVEHYSGRPDLLIDNAEMKHVVYVYKCENCTLQIKGKVNSIILDSCKKMGIVFETVVSGLEFVNCQSVQAQVTGKLPTASIEKTDGCQLYLSKEAIDCQIISAKSSEMNVSIPKEDGDFAEFPIVEQFRSVWDGKTFVTEPTENAE